MTSLLLNCDQTLKTGQRMSRQKSNQISETKLRFEVFYEVFMIVKYEKLRVLQGMVLSSFFLMSSFF